MPRTAKKTRRIPVTHHDNGGYVEVRRVISARLRPEVGQMLSDLDRRCPEQDQRAIIEDAIRLLWRLYSDHATVFDQVAMQQSFTSRPPSLIAHRKNGKWFFL